MRFLYTLLLALAAPFLLLGLYRAKDGKPKVGKRWVEHFGCTPSLKHHEKPIWVHAVSVGEVIAAKPVIAALKAQYPALPILVTTTTATGAAIAATIDGIEHRYMPIDFGFAINRFLKHTHPKIMLIMETELWPNTLHAVHTAGIPVIVMNARLSEKSQRGYQRIQPLFNALSRNIDHVLCQFEDDARRFVDLGVDRDKISVSGSVKFDLPVFDIHRPDVTELKSQIGSRPVWIAASTHPNEDGILLDAHHRILKSQPDALMILVPRHPERFSSVAEIVKSSKLSLARRCLCETITADTQVYLGDTMGEMMTLFAVSNITFMAGSLIGEKVGGHNLLEPASLGMPLITGPSYFNFQVIAEQLIESGACSVKATPEEIAEDIMSLMANKEKREMMGHNALAVVERNRGALATTLATLAPWIN
ncbi:lipid IV(A) 3-deoxy-D-manno-octulosonic acid transferase [Enterovibrio nigricans]|uniref:3-deoxy-D-manno-octulosonic acid transferase n=1 Tax=Enterovibrio nigricans DSM 22720 TaxID=1121868 RepID=A0A1T4UH71_9GAMM|nr:lipid IV(A) 3-deoxy-D-manno-octulosonic acid transferase [Enterovibrio nigricans]PKF51302.1 3-deoxy-D-manno-octulosonic acid transferase [Enterovibrio nigricans]SKA52003.1 3-deoxy-D-manno-octulosonic-acid transferase [Enterovibrio nigricans DSM 22720]